MWYPICFFSPDPPGGVVLSRLGVVLSRFILYVKPYILAGTGQNCRLIEAVVLSGCRLIEACHHGVVNGTAAAQRRRERQFREGNIEQRQEGQFKSPFAVDNFQRRFKRHCTWCTPPTNSETDSPGTLKCKEEIVNACTRQVCTCKGTETTSWSLISITYLAGSTPEEVEQKGPEGANVILDCSHFGEWTYNNQAVQKSLGCKVGPDVTTTPETTTTKRKTTKRKTTPTATPTTTHTTTPKTEPSTEAPTTEPNTAPPTTAPPSTSTKKPSTAAPTTKPNTAPSTTAPSTASPSTLTTKPSTAPPSTAPSSTQSPSTLRPSTTPPITSTPPDYESCCPDNGVWSAWTLVVPCTDSCGSCTWSQWGSWSSCSGASCGECGQTKRTRICKSEHIGGCKCNGPSEETKPCKVVGIWGQWKQPSQCTDYCGGAGNMTKTRTCATEGTCPCIGDSSQTLPCGFSPCDPPREPCQNGFNLMYSNGCSVCGPFPHENPDPEPWQIECDNQCPASTTAHPQPNEPPQTSPMSSTAPPTTMKVAPPQNELIRAPLTSTAAAPTTTKKAPPQNESPQAPLTSTAAAPTTTKKAPPQNESPQAPLTTSTAVPTTTKKAPPQNESPQAPLTTSTAVPTTTKKACPAGGEWGEWCAPSSCTDTCGKFYFQLVSVCLQFLRYQLT
ncbi:SCO-spondin [Ditylenchus destructor]|nr:SCO-spondin [Ditylenchus destructor]